jgi:dipeptidyl aminopeptidase/acylaminoacyl peptidase
MLKSILGGFVVAVIVVCSIAFLNKTKIQEKLNTLGITTQKETRDTKYDNYSFDALRTRQGIPSDIIIDQILDDQVDYTSYLFYFTTEGKKVSGMLNVPKKQGTYPIIEMNRGFADPTTYQTGNGTKYAAIVFAQNGFITIAPDFLGYGKSDYVSLTGFDSRFYSYTTTLDLLASLQNLNTALEKKGIKTVKANPSKTGIWGHSNGGHISLSVLSITSGNYPTALWNPVSVRFPDSVLVYAPEESDDGKLLRKFVADFEKNYDVQKYSPPNYYHFIEAPIQLHQGEADPSVPHQWSDELYKNLKNMGKNITYFTYPGDDHNFNKGSWNTVVQRDVIFYTRYLK